MENDPMLKQKTFLEIVIAERTYQLTCDPSSPLGELHDVLTRMKYYVLQRMNEAYKQENPEQPPKEEKVVELEVE